MHLWIEGTLGPTHQVAVSKGSACCEECSAEGVFTCAKCSVVRYCGKECQKLNWRKHKHFCINKEDTYPLDDVTFSIVDPTAKAREFQSIDDPGYCIHLAGPDDDISNIADGDEIIVDKQTMSVLFSYCIGTRGPTPKEKKLGGWIYTFKAPSPAGFSRRDIARAVSDKYQWIYKEEERFAGQPPRMGGLFLNRGPTQGPFCISMHDLSDLVLHTLSYNYVMGVWTLGIDS